MVNYVLSFCKITGASRIFARNFYLPLLKPLTPKEALRTFRITGKWLLGSKYQHYIPVLRNHKQKRSKKCKNYGSKEHERVEDYKYMTPTFDPENEGQKRLKGILDSKKGDGRRFVYTVADKKYNIVFESAFELALRDGDIIDVLVSQKNDKILVKTKDCRKVPLEIQPYEDQDQQLYSGEGATTKKEETTHHHGKYTMSLAKMFEDKEEEEEKWEEEMKKILKRGKKKKLESTRAFKEVMKQILRKFDWAKFEEDAKKVVETIQEPVEEQPIRMEVNDLEGTKHVEETFQNNPDLLPQLPTIQDIPEILQSLSTATLAELNNVKGAEVTLNSGKKCFVTGQMVQTEDGEVFVPGQTVDNHYCPGFTINVDNSPALVNGLILGDQDQEPMFLPSQSAITSGGQLTFTPTTPEPEVQPSRKLLRIISMVPEEDQNDQEEVKEVIEDAIKESGLSHLDNVEIIVDSGPLSSPDRTSSEEEEEDWPVKERQEIDLKLPDDGMNDLVTSLEEKKIQLKKKLDDLRKFSVHSDTSPIVTYVDDHEALKAAAEIAEDNETINNLAEVLIAITRRTWTFKDRNKVKTENVNCDVTVDFSQYDVKFNQCSTKLKVLFKTALVVANDVYKNQPKDQVLAMQSVVEIVRDQLKKDPELVRELVHLLKSPVDRLQVCDCVLKQLTQDISNSKIMCLKKLTSPGLSWEECIKIVDKMVEKSSVFSVAFNKLTSLEKLLSKLREQIKKRENLVKDDGKALEVLQDSVTAAVDSLMAVNLQDYLQTTDSLQELVEDAVGLATALGLPKVVEDLSRLVNFSDGSLDILKRTLLIRQLSLKDHSLKRGWKNTDSSKIHQLVRESASLMSEKSSVENSRQIPYDILKNRNVLALEDFLIRKMRLDGAVLVSRGQIQLVVPESATRQVLAGRVPYVSIDESGVNSLKPLHLMTNKHMDYLKGARERSRSIDLDKKDYLRPKNHETLVPVGPPKKRKSPRPRPIDNPEPSPSSSQNGRPVNNTNDDKKIRIPMLIRGVGVHQVIPKEATRDVLTGKSAFYLVDDRDGVTLFPAKHILSVLKLDQPRAEKMAEYTCIGGHERIFKESNKRRDGFGYRRRYISPELLTRGIYSPDGQYVGTARGRAMSSGALFGHRI